MERISRTEMLMRIALAAAGRSTCPRKQVGAVVSRDGRPLVIGYNGAPPGQPHCLDIGCEVDEGRGGCIRATHAELNAIAYAARKGIELERAVIHMTVSPCLECAKMIVTAGLTNVYFAEQYRDHRGIDELEKMGVIVSGPYALT